MRTKDDIMGVKSFATCDAVVLICLLLLFLWLCEREPCRKKITFFFLISKSNIGKNPPFFSFTLVSCKLKSHRTRLWTSVLFLAFDTPGKSLRKPFIPPDCFPRFSLSGHVERAFFFILQVRKARQQFLIVVQRLLKWADVIKRDDEN